MNIATGGIALSILGLVGMLSMTSMPLIGASVLVYALGIRTCPPVMQAYLFDHLSKDTLGSDFGAIKTVYTGIGSLGPAFVGIIAERATYSAAFAQLIVCFVVSIALLWLQHAVKREHVPEPPVFPRHITDATLAPGRRRQQPRRDSRCL